MRSDTAATERVRDVAVRYWPLLAVAGAALVLRLVMVFSVHPTCPLPDDITSNPDLFRQQMQLTESLPDQECAAVVTDGLYIYGQGQLLADGHGWSSPTLLGLTDRITPGAGKPPAMVMMIAVLDKVGFGSPTAVRVIDALIGAGTVLTIGVVAWRLAGRRAGVIAAAIAALYPMLWINDWKLLNDGPYQLATALVVLSAYRLWRNPRPASAVELGAMIALATYTRSEASNLLVFLVIPLAWGLTRLSVQGRVKLGLLAGLTTMAFLAPWLIYNATRFEEPTLMSTGLGPVLLNGSCDQAWYGDSIGYLDFNCYDLDTLVATQLSVSSSDQVDESVIEKEFRDRATTYIRDNARRAPIVAAARVGRMFDLYKPTQNTQWNIDLEGRGRFDSWAGLLSYYALLPFAVGGVVVLWRRRIAISPLVAFVLSTAMVAMLSFGLTRYRAPVDVVICIAAAVAVDALWTWWAVRSRAGPTQAAAVEASRAVGGAPRPWPALTARGLGALVAGALVVAVVLFWSAGASPHATEPAAASSAPGTRQDACAFTDAHRLHGQPLYSRLGAGDLTGVRQDLEGLAPLMPPEYLPDIRRVQSVLDRLIAEGGSGSSLLYRLSPDERLGLFESVQRIFSYYEANCGG